MSSIELTNQEINQLNKKELENVAESILSKAKQLGASQCEVSMEAHKGYSVSVHDGSVESIEYHKDKGIDISVLFGKRSGSASLSDIRPEAISAAVEAAVHIAKFTDNDEASGLAEKDELAFNYPKLALFYPWSLTVQDAILQAIQCEKETLAFDKRIKGVSEVSISTGESLSIYANSDGFIGSYPYTRHDISCVAIAAEKKEMQRDFYYTVSTDPSMLESISHVAHNAARRVIEQLGSKKVRTGKLPVIFIAEAARGFLGHFAAAIQGGYLYSKKSFLLDQLNKPIFPAFVNIKEQPHLARALGSAPFDDDGVLTRPNIFVEQGILRNYALGVYSAKMLKMKTTGNAGGTHNLTIHPGNQDLVSLLKTMQKGLLVTELMGQGVNLLTGDYSRGAKGFWVENGEIQYPVHEVTIAGKLQDMYANIIAVGNDVDVRGNIRTGSILVEQMMIAGE